MDAPTTSAHFSDIERDAIYRVIAQRRDIRRFTSDPIAPDVLHRILTAAMQAPSVGYMQPWNFILIRDVNTRKQVHDAFIEANTEAQQLFPAEKQTEYAKLKLEGIIECPLNICITCDRTRFGPVVLGRTCQEDMDIYSTVCAVQNIWLAARAENIAVGWVSIIKTEQLKSILKIPEPIVPIAYLCIGHTPEFPAQPELQTRNWLPKIPLEDLIFHETWNNRI